MQSVVIDSKRGHSGARTHDRWLIRPSLYHLSYTTAVAKGGQGGIEPPTSPTLKENHTTRPMPHVAPARGNNLVPAKIKKVGNKIVSAWSGIRTHASRRDSNLSRAPWTARPPMLYQLSYQSESTVARGEPCQKRNAPARTKWSIGVSIPVPRACKARTLPIELMPRPAPAGN